MHLGIAVGALSALLVAIFGSLNKRFVERGEPLAITVLELGAGTLLLTLLAPAMPLPFHAFDGSIFTLPAAQAMGFMLVLSLASTTFPFALSVAPPCPMSDFTALPAGKREPVHRSGLAR